MKNLAKVPLRLVSSLLFAFPALLCLLQRTALRLSGCFDIVIALRLVKRPEWLLLPWTSHQARLLFTQPDLPAARDIAFASRIAESYATAIKESQHRHSGVGQGTLWDTLLQTHYARLHNILLSKAPVPLAEFLARLFQTETVNGYTNGTTFDALPHRWWTFATAIEVSLVCLAEAVGVARAECPEQGIIGHAMTPNAHTLVAELERYFGFRIEAPRVAAAKGVILGDRFLTREVCSQIYTAYRIRQVLNATGRQFPLRIVEIGGGYGGLCLWLHRMLGERIASYTIVDLPITNVVQAHFLRQTLKTEIQMYGGSGEPHGDTNRLTLAPHFSLEELPGSCDVLLNQDSMPELPASEVERYLDWGSRTLDGLFFNFNQEAYSVVNGVPQVLVPEVVSRFSNYRLLSRHTSWDRRGYVEEVYDVTPRRQLGDRSEANGALR